MNPVTVEHTFVTSLPNTQALQLLGQIVKSRGFDQQGEQEFDRDRPDWTIIHFHRGLVQGSRARAISQFYQTLRVEWDHGRFTLAITLDPHRAKTPVRQQCAELLLLICILLEGALTGARNATDVLWEWARHEDPLILAPGAAGYGLVTTGIRVPFWIAGCIAVNAIVLLVAVANSLPTWGKGLMLLLGTGSITLCVWLVMKKKPLPPERFRLITGGVTGGLLSFLIALSCLIPALHEQEKVNQQNAVIASAHGNSPATPSPSWSQPSNPSSATPSHNRPTSPNASNATAGQANSPSPTPLNPNDPVAQRLDRMARRKAQLRQAQLASPNTPAGAQPTADDLSAKLKKIDALWSNPDAKTIDLLAGMRGAAVRDDDGVVVLQGFGKRLQTSQPFPAPVTFRIVAMTDSTNIRLGYAANQIIFNWEMDPTELRIDGGPLAGHHKPNAGKVPINQWVAIELQVTETDLTIRVDGEERYHEPADFSKINDKLGLWTNAGATVRVKSVEMVQQ